MPSFRFFASVWTGDNDSKWAHLAITTPMLLSLSLAGMLVVPFIQRSFCSLLFDQPTQHLL
jgi:uncharacterized protein (DUF983 family)